MADAPRIAKPHTARETVDGPMRFLSLLAAPEAPRIWPDRIAVVVAHPDDETIGAGGQLSRFAHVTLIHVTDGAPRRHPDRARYAMLRRRELEAAMAMVGIPAEGCIEPSVADQEASLHLTGLARRLAAILADRSIDIVLTHPYEGGHPDHDATAFAVHGATWLMSRQHEAAPAIVEMAFYHAGSAGFRAQQFVPIADAPEIAVPLSTAAWALKQRMLAAHASQAGVVAQFQATVERFRSAPRYAFRAPPNGGAIYYEGFDWGMTAARWCRLAAASMDELGWAQP